MSAAKHWTIGPLHVRWVARDFRPLFSERYGYERWLKVGRLGVRWAA